jgi:hypothetical protein
MTFASEPVIIVGGGLKSLTAKIAKANRKERKGICGGMFFFAPFAKPWRTLRFKIFSEQG